MRSTRKAAIIVRVVIMLTVIPCYARVDSEYMKWSGGEFEMPPSLKQAQDRLQLEPFMQSSQEFLRMAAVRRLAQIEGPKAAALLRGIAAKEPVNRSPDYVPLVKLEVVRQLERIPGVETESALIGLWQDYWSKRGDLHKDVAFGLYDFSPVCSRLLDAFYSKANSKAVLRSIERVALSEEISRQGLLPDWFRQKVWEVYLKAKVIDSGAASDADQVEMLLLELNAADRQWPFGYMSLPHIKALAARSVISRHGPGTLGVVEQRLSQEIDSRSYLNSNDPQKRYMELTENRAFLRKVIRDHLNSGRANPQSQ